MILILINHQCIAVPAWRREPQTWFVRLVDHFHHNLNCRGGRAFLEIFIYSLFKLWISCSRLGMKWCDLLVIAKWEEFKVWLFGWFEGSQRRVRLQPDRLPNSRQCALVTKVSRAVGRRYTQKINSSRRSLFFFRDPACSVNVAEDILMLRR